MTDISRETQDTRSYLYSRYLHGSGIEVGALDAPFPVSEHVQVRYVDRFAKQELLRHYPELLPRQQHIIDPDIVDNGETLGSIGSRSIDFLIASHFLEHCENPLGTLRNFSRVVKPGGKLMIVVPNSSHPDSWDAGRPLTSFEHLISDDRDGPHRSRRSHFMEWVTYAGKMSGEVAERECAKLMKMNYSIHFHCWSGATFLPFLVKASEYNRLDLHVMHYEYTEYEILAVLSRAGPSHEWGPEHP
jgi:SAM-dependent methyltransferase